MPVAKYIITPDYKPLHALKKRFGPRFGPLKTPTLVDISVIHDLLKQKNPPVLLEVIPENPSLTKYGTPVELTLENYQLPYDEILAPKVAEDSANKDKDDNEYEINPPEKAPNPSEPDEGDNPSEQSENPTDFTDEELEALRKEYGEDA